MTVTSGRATAASLLAALAIALPGTGSAMMHGEMDKMKGSMPANKPMPGQVMPMPQTQPMPGMSTMESPMGRMRTPAMGGMASQSALPGFPGASHLYHVGATGFFLDHPEHVALSAEQQMSLNRIKEKSMLSNADAERRIEEAEQELWTLTAAESPDGAKIDGKIRAIEKLRGDQRMSFIRAVGEAARVLTPEQRASLLGAKPSAAAKPAPMKPMKDM
jgi:Spy/CpxP family protein refolding chaperone